MTILNNPEIISLLPNEWYVNFMCYIIQEEMYEYISKLQSLKGVITNKTWTEINEECDRECE